MFTPALSPKLSATQGPLRLGETPPPTENSTSPLGTLTDGVATPNSQTPTEETPVYSQNWLGPAAAGAVATVAGGLFSNFITREQSFLRGATVLLTAALAVAGTFIATGGLKKTHPQDETP